LLDFSEDFSSQGWRKSGNYLKMFLKREKNLLFFPHHLDCFLRALVGTDTAALAEIQVDFKVIIDDGIGTIGCAEPARIAHLLINPGLEYSPGSGFPGCSFGRSAHGQPHALLWGGHAFIS
jgi:hypothetical protein